MSPEDVMHSWMIWLAIWGLPFQVAAITYIIRRPK